MTQDAIIKFRLPLVEKDRIEAAAERRGMSMSALIRGAAHQALARPSIDTDIRSDLVAIRSAANQLLAAGAEGDRQPVVLMPDMHAAVAMLRERAASLLGRQR